ncbi:MAG: ribosome maturation factor RimP [Halothiobacillaceae bacterium]
MDIPNPQDSLNADTPDAAMNTPVVGMDNAILTRHDPFNLNGMFAPIAQGMGLELVGVEFHSGSHAVVRVFIDREILGVTVDDCAQMSRAISALMDVEDPIPGQYTLEVSSPGFDRPLFKLRDFARFAGEFARIRLHRPLMGLKPSAPGARPQRNFSGTLQGVDGYDVLLAVDEDTTLRLPFADIDKAHLEPDLKPL